MLPRRRLTPFIVPEDLRTRELLTNFWGPEDLLRTFLGLFEDPRTYSGPSDDILRTFGGPIEDILCTRGPIEEHLRTF